MYSTLYTSDLHFKIGMKEGIANCRIKKIIKEELVPVIFSYFLLCYSRVFKIAYTDKLQELFNRKNFETTREKVTANLSTNVRKHYFFLKFIYACTIKSLATTH